MELPKYKFIDPKTLATVDEVFTEIDNILVYFSETAEAFYHSDADLKELKLWFKQHVEWLKIYYERAEWLIINET